MSQIGSITNKVLSTHKQIIESANSTLGNDNNIGNFRSKMEKALDSVADAQKIAADSTRNFELGIENDLTKVMINQQISSLGFQLTLNTRNKVLSAYKDIMSMPV
jgi:flagellar hook-basal body complex protein FliE